MFSVPLCPLRQHQVYPILHKLCGSFLLKNCISVSWGCQKMQFQICKAVSSLFSICICLSCISWGKGPHFSNFKINLITPFQLSFLLPILILNQNEFEVLYKSKDALVWAKLTPLPPPPVQQPKYIFYQNLLLQQQLQTHFFFKILFIYSWETQRERSRDTDWGRSSLHAGRPMWDSILGLQDHALGWRQVLNHWTT